MRVCLMPDVPNKPISRRVKYVVHRNGKFDRAEACSRVSADTRARVDNVLTCFVRDRLQILDTILPQVGG